MLTWSATFGNALPRLLIAWGAGLFVTGVGSGMASSGVFAFFGAVVAAGVGFVLGQRIYEAGARIGSAVATAAGLFALASTALGGSAFVVGAVTAFAVYLGWNRKDKK
ncbi:hypothetical protein [Neoroseomonas rubea]|uniref:hypothetical protein n=1 Tax=Neoroseomonas rubea TaxID=2748666 RepID=UPI0018E0643D|nr:hypothetical protein [Roseomonas rubea]